MKFKIITFSFLMVIVGLAYGQPGEIVTVKGRGVGEDMASALKDAYRDAIETAVGLYVDAEQMVKNDELLKDQVLTQSNAYIEGYDVLSKKVGDGMVSIKIIAKVRTRALTKKVSGFMKPRTVEVGSALKDSLAKDATLRMRGQDGALLLKKVITGKMLEKKALDCRLITTDGVVADNNDPTATTQDVCYLFEISVDHQRYFEEIAPLQDVLRQVSVVEPVKIIIPVERGKSFAIADANPKGLTRIPALTRRASASSFGLTDYAVSLVPRCQALEVSSYNNPASKDRFRVVVVASVNKSGTAYTAYVYELDQYSWAEMERWCRFVDPRQTGYEKTLPKFAVSFLDEDGEILYQQVVKAESDIYRVRFFADIRDNTLNGQDAEKTLIINPWFSCVNKSILYRWEKVALPKAIFSSLKSIKIETAP